MKSQRIRDPLHDLIEFNESNFEQGLWKAVETPEFQRLRRIKQLGFSELVYPGATHTRFIHSVGVFHTARILLNTIKEKIESFDAERAEIALTAALVHDIGHGPFSHAFETANKKLNKIRKSTKENRHEVWTAEIIKSDTAMGEAIGNCLGLERREAVANLLLQETPTDIYSAIVSSQLDADRLDYIRRDRLMTGAQHGGFDFSWMLANFEVDNVTFSTDDEEYATSEILILGGKSFQAAEAYVLGLFHMYFAVYFHKATRSAESMLTALLVQLGMLCDDNGVEMTGLTETHPLIEFVKDQSLGNYLLLDDSVLWGGLPLMIRAKDDVVRGLSQRLMSRQLYKAICPSSEHLAQLAA